MANSGDGGPVGGRISTFAFGILLSRSGLHRPYTHNGIYLRGCMQAMQHRLGSMLDNGNFCTAWGMQQGSMFLMVPGIFKSIMVGRSLNLPSSKTEEILARVTEILTLG